jgi:hypothetical protein
MPECPVCDEAFGLYLITMAEKVTEEGYKLVVGFIECLRTCLNEKGWSLPGEADNMPGVYCEVRNPQNIPEASNHFITEFLEANASGLDRDTAIELTMHFNRWLFIKRFSNLKLSLCNDKE